MTNAGYIPEALALSRDKAVFRLLLDSVKLEAERLRMERLGRPPSIMEVCGSHTRTVSYSGLRDLLDGHIDFVSGPGCPVCVTSDSDLAGILGLAKTPNVTVATFGDMLRVPSPGGSLEHARAQGAKVAVTYSPMDALSLAESHPSREVVFLGIGFETTAPLTAVTVQAAQERGIRNFSVYSVHKTMPRALDFILSDGNLRVDGLLLPGHVSAITGRRYFDFVGVRHKVPSAVAGFEPCDILLATREILLMLASGEAAVRNMYPRAVREEGNQMAMSRIYQVFEEADSLWRGLGSLPASGLSFSKEYRRFDARHKFDLPPLSPQAQHPGCDCKFILTGAKKPGQCRSFGRSCTPTHPLGPCMVSSEGACRAHYEFGRRGVQ
ncbi:MAG: hydrogenase formation protein HypD [Bacillota bacterium]|jgi:hydrogenase expression/formation protein HypD